MKRYKLKLGDCLEVMPTIKDNGVDAIICDPPYSLNFMGKDWDRSIPGIPYWKEALRIAKPGAHLLAFGGTRTHHRLMVAIEDAGWEIRDVCMWLYGSGMPKSHDVSKAIDRMAGAEREVVGEVRRWGNGASRGRGGQYANGYQSTTIGAEKFDPVTAPSTDEAKQWDGWGTGLKPAWEPIILARKPISEKTIADNVLKWGCGALAIDKCRIGTDGGGTACNNRDADGHCLGHPTANGSLGGGIMRHAAAPASPQGRWPANLIHDGSEEVVSLFPATKTLMQSAARFFYSAKASKSERGEGNDWPTVKPISLMRYLCRLITPPNGIIVDPFMGSASTGVAALEEGFLFYGIDSNEHAFEIATRRIEETMGRLQDASSNSRGKSAGEST